MNPAYAYVMGVFPLAFGFAYLQAAKREDGWYGVSPQNCRYAGVTLVSVGALLLTGFFISLAAAL